MIDTDRIIARTQSVAEQIRQAGDALASEVKDRSEPTADQVQTTIDELIDWARRNGERVLSDLDDLRTDLGSRLAPVTVVTKADLAELEARVVEAERTAAKALRASKAARKGAGTKGSGTKQSATKRTATTKQSATSAAAEKAGDTKA